MFQNWNTNNRILITYLLVSVMSMATMKPMYTLSSCSFCSLKQIKIPFLSPVCSYKLNSNGSVHMFSQDRGVVAPSVAFNPPGNFDISMEDDEEIDSKIFILFIIITTVKLTLSC